MGYMYRIKLDLLGLFYKSSYDIVGLVVSMHR